MASSQKKRTGRPPGESQTRKELLQIAARRFAETGYSGTSLRAITTEAGVDPTLVRHFFGDKEGLFREAVLEQAAMRDVILESLADADIDEIGVRLVEAWLDVWEREPSAAIPRAVLRTALESDEARALLQDVISAEAPRSAQMLPGNVELPGTIFAFSHLLGICTIRYVLRLEPLASMDRSEVVAMVGPLIQQALQPTATAPEQREE
ncbi:TetR/AcrR family transcriptional regulator [Brevibacterium otitidis]|uniref:TetR family transcriptional regulator n=1 Tax=Brevibacterium otitidis TaxID=53364 RepID=A0ABV5X0T0_9MICO|nr:TetR family transcriptional regulator [Brevibacterium otitidis]